MDPLTAYYRLRSFREDRFRTTYILANEELAFVKEIYEVAKEFPPKFSTWDPQIIEDVKRLEEIIIEMDKEAQKRAKK